jgi:hypothetical protein
LVNIIYTLVYFAAVRPRVRLNPNVFYAAGRYAYNVFSPDQFKKLLASHIRGGIVNGQKAFFNWVKI